jgi:DNA-binding NarL/FixJ family response regulator
MICDRDENKFAALRAGISGFLHKKAGLNKLYSVVKIVNLGGYYFNSSFILKVFKTISFINQFPGQFIDIQNKWVKENSCFSLSSIEIGIIFKIAIGNSDKEIAKHFNYSEGTIRNIVNTIKRKTKLKNRMQIVIFSLVYGLINMDHLDIFKHRQFINDTIQ